MLRMDHDLKTSGSEDVSPLSVATNTKQCSVCHERKPLDEFYTYQRIFKRTGHEIKHKAACKDCSRKKGRAWCKTYREKKPAFVKQRQKEWRDNNKEYLKVKKREWNENNREHMRSSRKQWRKDNIHKAILSICLVNAKIRAEKKGVACTVTLEYLLEILKAQDNKCALSGIDMTFGGGGRILATSCSIDRIEQSRGYVEGNVRFICHAVNSFRGSMSDKEFRKFIESITWSWEEKGAV